MTKPIWISTQLALTIHDRQLAEHGGIAGVRDEGLLDSVLARPKHLHAYSKPLPPISQLAAAYAFGIAKNHPLLDGNKRTAAVVCETFVTFNGCELAADDESMYITFVKLAEGSLNEEELAEWLETHLKQVK